MTENINTFGVDSRLLDTAVASEMMGVSKSYLSKLRVTGGGPRYVKIGRRVAYRSEDLQEWLISCIRASTSEGSVQ
ncbi:helix-turn-helix transcriptional regulator [Sphingomicrobium arenosum]|uniref:helix-turn-helix transcriptional regulator n=1 Tax=Sphingomicrobium arenosum TaxID=2233861 RepID=UPI0022403276|nr:helix-turn-helix domain-containing protein [Sphingomicrobium arenosum]